MAKDVFGSLTTSYQWDGSREESLNPLPMLRDPAIEAAVREVMAETLEKLAAEIENVPGNMDTIEAYQYAAELIRERSKAMGLPPCLPSPE